MERRTVKKRRGLLLINVGTPDSPEPVDVARYLREFLMDGYVIDIPWLWRWIFVHLLIVPRRQHESSALYKTIWTEEGSPLLVHLENLAEGVRAIAGERYVVETAMRYGRPSILAALERLQKQDLDEIVVFPLYPQYAESSTRTSQEACEKAARRLGMKTRLRFVPAFPTHPGFISAFAHRVQEVWSREKPDHLLISFHGLPERQLLRTDLSGGKHCLQSANCCDRLIAANRDCYRAQCYATARTLAQAVGISDDRYSVSFQSRLGRTPWIKPYTDVVIAEMAKSGVKNLAVTCPSFVADCLETTEEIGVRAREIFMESGGERFSAISCLNSDPEWIRAAIDLADNT